MRYEFVIYFKDGFSMNVYSTDIQGTIYVIETEIDNLERWTMEREREYPDEGWEHA